eukprot:7183293-Prymnesium_polylepis.1
MRPHLRVRFVKLVRRLRAHKHTAKSHAESRGAGRVLQVTGLCCSRPTTRDVRVQSGVGEGWYLAAVVVPQSAVVLPSRAAHAQERAPALGEQHAWVELPQYRARLLEARNHRRRLAPRSAARRAAAAKTVERAQHIRVVIEEDAAMTDKKLEAHHVWPMHHLQTPIGVRHTRRCRRSYARSGEVLARAAPLCGRRWQPVVVQHVALGPRNPTHAKHPEHVLPFQVGAVQPRLVYMIRDPRRVPRIGGGTRAPRGRREAGEERRVEWRRRHVLLKSANAAERMLHRTPTRDTSCWHEVSPSAPNPGIDPGIVCKCEPCDHASPKSRK